MTKKKVKGVLGPHVFVRQGQKEHKYLAQLVLRADNGEGNNNNHQEVQEKDGCTLIQWSTCLKFEWVRTDDIVEYISSNSKDEEVKKESYILEQQQQPATTTTTTTRKTRGAAANRSNNNACSTRPLRKNRMTPLEAQVQQDMRVKMEIGRGRAAAASSSIPPATTTTTTRKTKDEQGSCPSARSSNSTTTTTTTTEARRAARKQCLEQYVVNFSNSPPPSREDERGRKNSPVSSSSPSSSTITTTALEDATVVSKSEATTTGLLLAPMENVVVSENVGTSTTVNEQVSSLVPVRPIHQPQQETDSLQTSSGCVSSAAAAAAAAAAATLTNNTAIKDVNPNNLRNAANASVDNPAAPAPKSPTQQENTSKKRVSNRSDVATKSPVKKRTKSTKGRKEKSNGDDDDDDTTESSYHDSPLVDENMAADDDDDDENLQMGLVEDDLEVLLYRSKSTARRLLSPPPRIQDNKAANEDAAVPYNLRPGSTKKSYDPDTIPDKEEGNSSLSSLCDNSNTAAAAAGSDQLQGLSSSTMAEMPSPLLEQSKVAMELVPCEPTVAEEKVQKPDEALQLAQQNKEMHVPEPLHLNDVDTPGLIGHMDWNDRSNFISKLTRLFGPPVAGWSQAACEEKIETKCSNEAESHGADGDAVAAGGQLVDDLSTPNQPAKSSTDCTLQDQSTVCDSPNKAGDDGASSSRVTPIPPIACDACRPAASSGSSDEKNGMDSVDACADESSTIIGTDNSLLDSARSNVGSGASEIPSPNPMLLQMLDSSVVQLGIPIEQDQISTTATNDPSARPDSPQNFDGNESQDQLLTQQVLEFQNVSAHPTDAFNHANEQANGSFSNVENMNRASDSDADVESMDGSSDSDDDPSSLPDSAKIVTRARSIFKSLDSSVGVTLEDFVARVMTASDVATTDVKRGVWIREIARELQKADPNRIRIIRN